MITLILIAIATFLFCVYFNHKFSYWSRKGIKGPKALPFVGTLLEESKLNPNEIEHKFLKEYGPVFGTYLGTFPIFNTSRVEDIKMVLSDIQTFPNTATLTFNDKYLKRSMFFKNSMKWKTARQAQTHYFTGKKLRDLFPHFDKVTENLLDNIANIRKETGTDDIEIKSIALCYSLDTISKILFSIDIDSYKERDSPYVRNSLKVADINKYQSALLTILPTKISGLLGLCLFNIKPLEKVGDYFKTLIKERRKSGIKYNDLIESIQDAVDSGKAPLDENEVIGNVLLSFFAGIEPVGNAFLKSIGYLSKNKHAQDKLYEEIVKEFSDEITYEKITQAPYLDAVFNETIRLGNGFLHITRSCAKDVNLNGYNLEKGTEIRLVNYIAQMPSDEFGDPKSFNPDRFLKKNAEKTENETNENGKSLNWFQPFGFGAKMCLGMRLAQIEIKYMLVKLLQNYEILKADNPREGSMSFRGFLSSKELYVKLKKRV